jgi:thiol-disulfide isomerase/thioredoxin
MTTVALILAMAVSGIQDKPQDIAKKDLPKSAECVVCSAQGGEHGEEKPVAGVKYKGKSYFFCNGKEVATFKANPDMYLPLELPFELPSLALKDQTGKVWDAEAMKGKLVLLDYWATWCKPCLALKPKLDKVRTTYKDKGFEMLSLSIDEKRDTLDKFLKKTAFENPVLWDDKQTWAKLKVVAIPALFLVKDGKVIAAFKGEPNAKQIEAAVKANLTS